MHLQTKENLHINVEIVWVANVTEHGYLRLSKMKTSEVVPYCGIFPI